MGEYGYESWFVSELTLSSSQAAYEYGARQPAPGVVPQPLPEG